MNASKKIDYLEELFGRDINSCIMDELDQTEKSLIERVNAKSKELGVCFRGIASGKEVYLSFPPRVKEEFKNREKNIQHSVEERERTLDGCFFKFLAYYDAYPPKCSK